MRILTPNAKTILIAELLVMMAGIPLLLWLVLPPKAILPVLWVAAILCNLIAARINKGRQEAGWLPSAINRANLRPLLLRFLLCAVLLTAATAIFSPTKLFEFVRHNPNIWALVMVLYPLLSVVPQEIIFRRYVFARFGGLFSNPVHIILLSGLGFAFAHIAFNNWVAPLLCAIGGVLFAQTYHKTRSLALVCLEHALYGDLIFTLGLGRYFYHGAIAVAHT